MGMASHNLKLSTFLSQTDIGSYLDDLPMGPIQVCSSFPTIPDDKNNTDELDPNDLKLRTQQFS